MGKWANGGGGGRVQRRMMNSQTRYSRGPVSLLQGAVVAALLLAWAGCTSTGSSTVIDPPTPPGLPDTPEVEVPNPPGVK